MATLGHIGKFEPTEENILAYLERLELFFTANGIKDEKKVVVLLSVIGPKIYALLRDLIAPDKPQDKLVADLKCSRSTMSQSQLLSPNVFVSIGETKLVGSQSLSI